MITSIESYLKTRVSISYNKYPNTDFRLNSGFLDHELDISLIMYIPKLQVFCMLYVTCYLCRFLDTCTKFRFQHHHCVELNPSFLLITFIDLIVQAKSGTGKTCVFSTIALDSLILDNAATQVQ